MHSDAGRRRNNSEVTIPVCGPQIADAVGNQEETPWFADAVPVVEISDKDYRSFALPCAAFEEPDDCDTGA